MKIKGLKIRKIHNKKDFLKNLLIFGTALGFMILSIFTIWVASLKIPSLDAIEKRKIEESTKIYDKNGVLLYDVHSNKKRTIVSGDAISENAKYAMISIEDEDFYTHKGVRPLAVINSVIEKIMSPSQRLRGGSTITQQVVKNSILTAERSISRKVKEWVLAYKLEDILSKDEILSMYLNEISFGGTIYGIEQASLSFFGKNASDLDVAEAAYLAAIPKAPTYYSPFGQNKDELEDRKNLVLSKMFELGFITQKQYVIAKEEIVVFEKNKVEDRSIKAPHFVLMLKEMLEEKYGVERIENGGLSVYTTIDSELQKDLEEIVKRNALENEEKYGSENAGLVAIESQTGKVIAMVGSRDYFDEDIDGKYNIATALRQPGSTFKPLIYSLTFEKGYLPETAIWDTKTEFSSACYPDGQPISGTNTKNCYNPVNFDYKFKGPMNFRSALAESRNIPAVKAAYLADYKNLFL
jgi:membrane peptidoglycan carboxypeptidase